MTSEFYAERYGKISIQDEKIGEGAEGSIHEVLNPPALKNYVVKLYKDREKNRNKQEKIKYLIRFKPKLKNPDSVIFPEDLIFDNGIFAGFLMKKAKGQYDLTSLCSLNNSARLPEELNQKFNRSSPLGMRRRMRICYEIASAFNAVHKTGRFTFVDIKPENIKFGREGCIAIVDIDSIAIADGHDLLFPAEKLTQEYSPSEYLETNLQEDLIDETWDRFSLSILFYKILFGIHPHAGTTKGPYQNHTSNEQKIVEGLFPHSEKKEFFDAIPTPHQQFKTAPSKVKQLFMNCFVEGHMIPHKRPSAADWTKVFSHSKPKKYRRALFNQKLKSLKPQWKFSFTRPAQKTKRIKTNAYSGIRPTLYIFSFLFLVVFTTSGFNYFYQMKKFHRDFKNAGENVKETAWSQMMKNIIKHDYESIEYVKAGRYRVSKGQSQQDRKFGYVDGQNTLLTPIKYDYVSFFKNERAMVKLNGQYGYINLKGETITTIQYDMASHYRGGMARVKRGNDYFFIDLKGMERIRIPRDYQAVSDFYQGMASFKKQGKWGFIDMNGREIISPIYDQVYPFHEGRAMVKIDKYWGYINKKGVLKVPARWEQAHSFSRGEALVSFGGKEYVIDKNGNILYVKRFLTHK